jgi:hypothetical protein
MGYSRKEFIKLIEHVDLPGHDDVVRMTRQWNAVLATLESIVPVLFICAAIKLLSGDTTYAVMAGCGLLVARFLAYLSNVVEPAHMIGVLLPILAGAVWFLSKNVEATVTAGIIAIFSPLVCALVGMLWHWVSFLSTPVVGPVMSLVAGHMNGKIARELPAWRSPSVSFVFQRKDLSFQPGNTPVFVAYKSLRRNGEAQKLGIPLFTHAQFSNPAHVRTTMNAALAEAEAQALSSDTQVQWANPATGLPTVGNMAGGIDVAGNQWGRNAVMDINPGSGLPTVAGPGTHDVAGNAWGENHHG